MKKICITLAAFAAAAAAPAAVIVVDSQGGGDFTEIQSAIDAAQSGDTLLVKGGTYAHFTIDQKALTVVAEKGQTVQTYNYDLGGLIYAPNVVTNVAATMTVTVRGIDGAFVASHCDGRVRFEDVTTTGKAGTCDPELGLTYDAEGGMFVQDSDAVSFVHCTLQGAWGGFVVAPPFVCCSSPASGLIAKDSNVAVYQSTITLGKGFGSCADAPLIDQTNGAVFVYDASTIGPRDLTGTSPLRKNEGGQIVVSGQPGDYVLLLLSLHSGFLSIGGVTGTLLLDGPFSGVFVLGPLPAASLNISISFPDLPPIGFESIDVPLQIGYVTTGGQGIVGPLTVMTVLDAGI